MSKYSDLNHLEDLRAKGAISEEEYCIEKERIMSTMKQSSLFGLSENSYLVIMHLSQYAGFIVWGLGFIVPIIMWLTNKENEKVDQHGKNIANFMISMLIYFTISGILSFLLIGIPMLIAFALMEVVCVIVAAVKASDGIYWKYPITIKFFT